MCCNPLHMLALSASLPCESPTTFLLRSQCVALIGNFLHCKRYRFVDEDATRLARRVDELERHLAEYHDRLEAALEHDRQFQLGATWGIVRGASWLAYLGLFSGGTYLWRTWIGEPGWIANGVVAITAFAGMLVSLTFVERGAEGDKAKLSRLPNWIAELNNR